MFWLAANSAHLFRGKRLHIDYKAALLVPVVEVYL